MAHPCPICDLEPRVLKCGTVELDRRTCTVRSEAGEISVTPTQFEILELFMVDPGRVWSKRALLGQLDPVGMVDHEGKCLEVHLHYLRKRVAVALRIINKPRFGWFIEPVGQQEATQ